MGDELPMSCRVEGGTIEEGKAARVRKNELCAHRSTQIEGWREAEQQHRKEIGKAARVPMWLLTTLY